MQSVTLSLHAAFERTKSIGGAEGCKHQCYGLDFHVFCVSFVCFFSDENYDQESIEALS